MISKGEISLNEKENSIYDEYILCFKDFQPLEYKRKPCIFIKIRNLTRDSKEEIMKKFAGVRIGTNFLNEIGVADGMWGLIACSPIKEIITTDYEVN